MIIPLVNDDNLKIIMVLVVGNNVVLQKPPVSLEDFLHSSSRLVVDVNTFKGRSERVIKEQDGEFAFNSDNISCQVT